MTLRQLENQKNELRSETKKKYYWAGFELRLREPGKGETNDKGELQQVSREKA